MSKWLDKILPGLTLLLIGGFGTLLMSSFRWVVADNRYDAAMETRVKTLEDQRVAEVKRVEDVAMWTAEQLNKKRDR